MMKDPRIRSFVELERQKMLNKKIPALTIQDIVKDHNHEIWRACTNCGNVFDLRKELDFECPKCQSKEIIK
ncbi:hypothetical protein [Elizabethkingia anophelis]|uniref:hypothetical protein n=1 Tax=Elizabethkingia anophelis TaxID=1117645 RepID=UPI0029842DC0|nr:hypothetical protein [Elizabethkingia anophelis]HAY3545872.1 hypothetical protein [Elizabethkingia anophelis]HAY3590698.1 hypothetical protein [Elizabethkingia anophelis]